MNRSEFSHDAFARAHKKNRRALDLAVAIGRKTALMLCGALGIAIVIVPLLALLAPELGR